MNYLHNIEKSAFRRFEYVGYGGGQVFRVRKDGCGAWEAFARDGAGYERAATLAKLSAKLEALPPRGFKVEGEIYISLEGAKAAAHAILERTGAVVAIEAVR